MSDKKAEMFGKSSIEDLSRGYIRDGQDYVCLHCEAHFEEGLVYQIEGGLALVERAVRDHVDRKHGGSFEALMALGPEAAGLTELQGRLMRYLNEGKGDREIAAALGGKSESTVRNHRFNLRKRAGEARVFLALMDLVESPGRAAAPEAFLDYPAGMPLRDERTAVTASEAAAIEARCLRTRGDGSIEIGMWPRKQKEKLVVLLRVAGLFERGKMYSEQEVNAVLMPVYGDHVTIRRYLIEYRLLDRRPDGSAYWRC